MCFIINFTRRGYVMKLKIGLGLVTMLLVLPVMGHTVTSSTLKQNRFVYGQMVYVQDLETTVSEGYPEWNPGDSACPLHPTNALQIAIQTATNVIPSVVTDPKESHLSLFERDGHWFYAVQLRLTATNGVPETWSRAVNLIVSIDGTVPEVKGEPNTIRRFGGGFRRAGPLPGRENPPDRQLTPEEQAQKRQEVRENLRQYQMEVIRSGKPPLPIPLTQEMDDRLVQEGILPPQKNPPNLSPINNDWTNSVPDKRPSSGIQND